MHSTIHRRYIDNFDVELIETLVNPEDNPHHWLQADILRIQNFIYHYFKDLTLNDQTIPQIKVISLFLRKYFRFNYQLLWSQQDQSAFTEFPDHFTLEECLPFIISEQNEHPYFHKPQLITKQTLDYIRFDPLLITENDLFPDNRPYHYQQNSQDQQNLHFNTNNSTEDDNTDQENTTQQQNQPENYNDNEFTTQESTILTYNPSQTGTSTSVHTHSFRVPTRIVNQRQNIHSPQSHLDTSPNRNITFNLPHTDDINDETHDTLQYNTMTTSSAQNTSANVASPTRTTSDSTRYITRPRYDPPLTHIPTDPLYRMHPNPNLNPNPNPFSPNTIQHIPPPLTQQLASSPQYLPMPQDTFINMSASIPEPMKPFDGLDHSYTPEEYLQQVEARLTFAIGEEPQNNPIKYKSWHNRRMAYIQCSIIGKALDWYTNLHISYKQQWNSFVQLFKKQFSSQKTAYYAQVELVTHEKG